MTRSESGRVNGAKSRGPITPEGRARSSQNSLAHGITSKTIILQNENPAEFLEMYNSYREYLQPANQIELDLMSDLVSARWRLRRIWRYSTALLDLEMDAMAADFDQRFTQHDEDMRGSLAFSSLADKGKGFNTAYRYEVHLSRVYRRTLAEFERIAKRTGHEAHVD